MRCWARCPICDTDFMIDGVIVPCPITVYIAALKSARCPQCGRQKGLLAYSPGLTPDEARKASSFDVKLST